MTSRLALGIAVPALAACAAQAPLASAVDDRHDTVAVIDDGWHTDIALPADELYGGLRVFQEQVFPGAKTIIFGFGKRTFMVAPVHTIGDLIIGPVPGDGAIEVSAISVTATIGFPDLPVAVLSLPPGGAAALSDFIWNSIAHDANGRPDLLAAGPWLGSLFYASTVHYSLLFTCNAWSAATLRSAGLGIRTTGVFFASDVMDQLRQPAPGNPRIVAR